MDAGITNELSKSIKKINFEVPFGTLSDAVASPREHHAALGLQKVSSFSALDSGRDSGLDFGPSQICRTRFSLKF